MDPITLAIVTAIITGLVTGVATGTTTGVAKASEQAIVDGYNSLKKLIIDKFGAQSKAVQALSDLEIDPKSEGRKIVLKEELTKVKATDDGELIKAAETLLARLNALPDSRTIIKQLAIGDNNVQIAGDSNKVNFKPPKST